MDDIYLPPLQVVIDSVMTRNGMLNLEIKKLELKSLASERIYWTRNLGFQAESSYGI
jgi:hypothetical protein